MEFLRRWWCRCRTRPYRFMRTRAMRSIAALPRPAAATGVLSFAERRPYLFTRPADAGRTDSVLVARVAGRRPWAVVNRRIARRLRIHAVADAVVALRDARAAERVIAVVALDAGAVRVAILSVASVTF